MLLRQAMKTVVAVAQLVESRIVIPVVVGSSPIGHPTVTKDKAHFLVGFFVFNAFSNSPHSVTTAPNNVDFENNVSISQFAFIFFQASVKCLSVKIFPFLFKTSLM